MILIDKFNITLSPKGNVVNLRKIPKYCTKIQKKVCAKS